jgi:hypothetical protein
MLEGLIKLKTYIGPQNSQLGLFRLVTLSKSSPLVGGPSSSELVPMDGQVRTQGKGALKGCGPVIFSGPLTGLLY